MKCQCQLLLIVTPPPLYESTFIVPGPTLFPIFVSDLKFVYSAKFVYSNLAKQPILGIMQELRWAVRIRCVAGFVTDSMALCFDLLSYVESGGTYLPFS